LPALNSRYTLLIFSRRLSNLKPHSAVVIGAILRAPRNIRHSGNFSYVFSPIREQQLDYVDGILVVSSIFCIAWVLWAFTVLVLKFKGKQVGCASGRAFVTGRSEDKEYDVNKHSGDTQDDYCSTSESSGDGLSNSSKRMFSQSTRRRSKHSQSSRRRQSKDEENEECLGGTVDEEHSLEILSQSSGWISGTYSDNLRDFQNEPLVVNINPHENRTRVCFVFFASIVLICMPLTMFFSYGPMKEATDGSDELILVRFILYGDISTTFVVVES
jgi:hypothetical protein